MRPESGCDQPCPPTPRGAGPPGPHCSSKGEPGEEGRLCCQGAWGAGQRRATQEADGHHSWPSGPSLPHCPCPPAHCQCRLPPRSDQPQEAAVLGERLGLGQAQSPGKKAPVGCWGSDPSGGEAWAGVGLLSSPGANSSGPRLLRQGGSDWLYLPQPTPLPVLKPQKLSLLGGTLAWNAGARLLAEGPALRPSSLPLQLTWYQKSPHPKEQPGGLVPPPHQTSCFKEGQPRCRRGDRRPVPRLRLLQSFLRCCPPKPGPLLTGQVPSASCLGGRSPGVWRLPTVWCQHSPAPMPRNF